MKLLRAKAVGVLGLAAMVLSAGCGETELSPCDAPERSGRAHYVVEMGPSMRDSLVHVFEKRNRVRRVELLQEACRFRATVRIDSFTTHRYAANEAIEMVRLLKQNAPNESRPLQQKVAGEVGMGLYDYSVSVVRAGREQSAAIGQQEEKPWVRVKKSYDATRVRVVR